MYIFSSSTEDDLGKAVKGIPGTYANVERPDLKGNWGTSVGELYGTKHGFDRTIDISDLSAGYVQTTFWIFAVVFTALLIADIGIICKQISKKSQTNLDTVND